MAETQDYKVQLEIFEGPLDLLLHLIRTQEVDIYDIPIARITEQYLRYLQMMQDLSINLAGEFLLMAATLIYIKSRMLLPPDPAQEGEESEDPRKDLVQQLLEHEKFKNAAQLLYERETVELSVWARGENEFAGDEQEMVTANVFDLVKAFHVIVERYKDQIVMEVTREHVTLEEKLAEIRKLLTVRKDFYFSMFLERKISRLHLVVTVLALLELVKRHEVRLFQKGIFEDIRIRACPTTN
ncbi:MAG: chromosome segregation protein ScpA [Acidobacteria bacterium]|nr:MAG: chromosome segregation protein ScpA [Acidobacteriota bacterium]